MITKTKQTIAKITKTKLTKTKITKAKVTKTKITKSKITKTKITNTKTYHVISQMPEPGSILDSIFDIFYFVQKVIANLNYENNSRSSYQFCHNINKHIIITRRVFT